MAKKTVELRLKGKACVFIDWANVYGWRKSLKKEVDPKKLYKYLRKYKEVKDIRFYYGMDIHPKSIKFLKNIKKIGYKVITKPVKHILVSLYRREKIYRRKCDFDMEICIDAHQALQEKYRSYIFFSGDGDFEPLYKLLVEHHKQVIVIYAHGHLGKEIYLLDKGVYKKAIDKLNENLFQ